MTRQGFNRQFANCAVAGWDDTMPALNETAAYLRDNDIVLVWYHPDDDTQLVLLAYAADAPSWWFLNDNLEPRPTEGLRIMARGTMAPVSSVRTNKPPMIPRPLPPPIPPLVPSAPVFDISPVRQVVPDLPSVVRGSSSQHRYWLRQAGPESPSVDISFSSPPPVHPPAASPSQEQPSEGTLGGFIENDDINSAFQKIGISFSELSTVATKRAAERCTSFYLHFPEHSAEIDGEFKVMEKFLEQRKIMPFSNRRPGDWSRFVLASKTGTIIVSSLDAPSRSRKLILLSSMKVS